MMSYVSVPPISLAEYTKKEFAGRIGDRMPYIKHTPIQEALVDVTPRDFRGSSAKPTSILMVIR